MKLKYRYATKEEIPAEHAAHYVEANGGWQLDAEGAASAEEVTQLQNRLTHADAERAGQKAEYEKSMQTVIGERQRLEARVAELEKNRGVGANPPLHGAPADTDENPFSAEHRNLTEQSRLVKSDPEKAKQLQAAAKRKKPATTA